MLADLLKDKKFDIPAWLFNVLHLRNPGRDHSLRPYYDFLLNEALDLEGDVAEFGVFRGDSLITTALMLAREQSPKRVRGFDSFSGFPGYHANDEPSMFKSLYDAGRISERHWNMVNLMNQAESEGLHRRHEFKETSQDMVSERIHAFALDNITLHAGDFAETLNQVDSDTTYCACLLDCDLYESYQLALPHCWSRLVPGGLIYLDEYYSLKYPGPRLAVDEFCETAGCHAERVLAYDEPAEFQRWFIRKV